jgi:hypothetical protein
MTPSPLHLPTLRLRRRTLVMALLPGGVLLGPRHARAQVTDLNDAINKAGRQRMLSQLLAKLYFVQSWAPEAAAKDLDTARGEFLAALKTLREAPEATPLIRQELVLAEQQWLFFDNALKRRDDAQHPGHNPARYASDVFRSSDNILQVMERVTGLYARLPS